MSGLLGAATRLAAGPGTIAYLGNSVTVQKDGYRPALHAALEAHFGHAHRAINAGFGGVGSIASACTMDDLIVRHRPDLCFVECMTGDMGVGLHPETGPALEGILRKLAAIGCSACLLNLPRQDADFAPANPIVRLYATLAAHHGMPAINLGERLAGAGDAFFRDVVHTTPAGGVRTAALIVDALAALFVVPGSQPASAPLFTISYAHATVLPAQASMLADGAAAGSGRFRLAYPYVDFGAGNPLRLTPDTATLVGLLLIAGPHSGPVRIGAIEHQLRDRWCSYDRLHAHIFAAPCEPGQALEIEPLGTARVKLIGFLAREP